MNNFQINFCNLLNSLNHAKFHLKLKVIFGILKVKQHTTKKNQAIIYDCRINNQKLEILQIEIDIEPTDKVERIKERVEEKEGIPPQQQRLIFSGKQMNDEKTAQDYKVQGGSVLHLVLALRGGYSKFCIANN